MEAIKQCVMAQMGITVLPKMAVERELVSGQLTALPWIDVGFHVMTQMLWHREKWLSPALQAFLAMVRESLATGVEKQTMVSILSISKRCGI